MRRLATIVFSLSFAGFFVSTNVLALIRHISYKPHQNVQALSDLLQVLGLLQIFLASPLLPFLLIFLLYVPINLFREYKRIIMTILCSGAFGGLSGILLGVISCHYLLLPNLTFRALFPDIRVIISSFVIHPFGMFSVGFSALTLSYIRNPFRIRHPNQSEMFDKERRAWYLFAIVFILSYSSSFILAYKESLSNIIFTQEDPKTVESLLKSISAIEHLRNLLGSPILPFLLVFLMCTPIPINLFKEYKRIIAGILISGYFGSIVGISSGFLFLKVPIDLWIPMMMLMIFPLFNDPISILFDTFSALSLIFIRKYENISKAEGEG